MSVAVTSVLGKRAFIQLFYNVDYIQGYINYFSLSQKANIFISSEQDVIKVKTNTYFLAISLDFVSNVLKSIINKA